MDGGWRPLPTRPQRYCDPASLVSLGSLPRIPYTNANLSHTTYMAHSFPPRMLTLIFYIAIHVISVLDHSCDIMAMDLRAAPLYLGFQIFCPLDAFPPPPCQPLEERLSSAMRPDTRKSSLRRFGRSSTFPRVIQPEDYKNCKKG